MPILFILASRYAANITLANICLKQYFAKYNSRQYLYFLFHTVAYIISYIAGS